MNNNRPIRRQTYTSNTIMLIVGVLILAGIGIYLYNNYKSIKNSIMPTATLAMPQCPDYWDSVGNSICQNTNSLGSCSVTPGANKMDFSGDIFTNANTGNYAKCKWSKACNVSWSGIDRLC
jgi:predicted negative regulator of RcsB-dependent stress response